MRLGQLPSSTPDVLSPLSDVHRLGHVIGLLPDGLLDVEFSDGSRQACAWLERASNHDVQLAPGDLVLVLALAGAQPLQLVMGRIGRYPVAQADAVIRIEATERLTLTCGLSSIDLNADGKVLIKGDDVTVKAKGTQRIRAGSVSIN